MLKFFGKKNTEEINSALSKTRGSLFGQIGKVFRSSGFNKETMEELEDILISSDLGYDTTKLMLSQLEEQAKNQRKTGGNRGFTPPTGRRRQTFPYKRLGAKWPR